MAWQIDELKTQNSFGTKTNSTGDLNLTGVAILSDNLTLAVTGNTNKKDLQDSYYSESMSLGISTSMNFGENGSSNESRNSPPSSALADARATAIPLNRGNYSPPSSALADARATAILLNRGNPTILGTGGKPSIAPGGSTSISGNYSQNESNRTTHTSIGSLFATLAVEKRDEQKFEIPFLYRHNFIFDFWPGR